MMRLVDRPTMFPSQCCLCGNAVNGPFLDAGFDLHDAKRKRIYLCNIHFLEALKVEKLVPLAELEQQVARLGEALGQAVQLEQQALYAMAEVAALQAKLDVQESSVQESRSTNRILEQRVADLTADPALVEHQRAVAELTESAS